MKHRIFALTAFLLSASVLLASCGRPGPGPVEEPGFVFYVDADAPAGGDGSESAPFSDIGSARDAIRERIGTGTIPNGGIDVFLSGTFSVTESILFTKEDSGLPDRTIRYRSDGVKGAVLDGGVSLDPASFRPASEAPGDVYSKLPEAVRGKVLCIDLAAAGCTDLDDSRRYGTGWFSDHYRQKLYVGNLAETVARWPNESDGYARIECACDTEDDPAVIRIPADKAAAWSGQNGIRMFAYPEYDWSGKHFEVLGTDPAASTLSFTSEEGFRTKDGRTYFVYNLPEELDEPGEYYWDTETRYLFYYPRENFGDEPVSFSQLYDHVIRIEGASYLEFEGITFQNYRGCGISGGRGGDNIPTGITVENCLFRDGQFGIDFTGNRLRFRNNEFCELGGRCLILDGATPEEKGDLAYSDISVTDNVFHDYALDYRVYNPGVELDGCGFYIGYNEFYNAPHSAILARSGDTVMEYNRIHDVCGEVDDCGAIYIGDRWDVNGTEIRYNYIYRVLDTTNGGSPYGIHLDDETSDVHCYGNILSEIGGDAFRLGGGHHLLIEHNLILGSGGFAAHLDDRGISWGGEKIDPGTGRFRGLEEHDIHSPLWRYRYAHLQLLAEVNIPSDRHIDDPGTPSYNRIRGNASYDCAGAESAPEDETSYAGMKYFDGLEICGAALAFGSFTDNAYYTENPGVDGIGTDEPVISPDARFYRDILAFPVLDPSLTGPRTAP